MLQPKPLDKSESSKRFEISSILLIAAGALALVSLYSAAAGIVGTWLSQSLRYLFGQMAVVPPLMLIGHALLSLRHGQRIHYTRRALSVVALFIVLTLAFHLIVGDAFTLTLTALREYSPSAPGGGVIGAIGAYVLVRTVGRGGSWVVLIAAALIAGVLLTNTRIGEIVGRVFGFIGRLGRGLALGWGDFWRGARAEVVELLGLWRDKRALRKERQAQKARQLTTTSVPDQQRPWRQKRAKKQRKQKRKGSLMPPGEPNGGRAEQGAARRAGNHADTVEQMEASPKPVGAEPAEAQAEAAATAETSAAPEQPAVPGRRPPRRVGAGDEVLEPETKGESIAPTEFYRLPPPALLERPKPTRRGPASEPDQAQQLAEALEVFGIEAKVVNVSRGPAVTRYELEPAPGVKVKQITSLADDLALALAASGIRIEAPVPGKGVVGIEVPNKETTPVYLREAIESDEFANSKSKLVLALGQDIAGKPVIADLTRLLHVLIAGATGSGKSVCINSIVVSILYNALPHEVKLLMIDPKRVELAVYDGIPHLVTPVVTDPKQAAAALRWAVKEMENRYARFSECSVRNIVGYNDWVHNERERLKADPENEEALPDPMPYIVVIIDELADLMMVAQHDVEDSIVRLAQMARAAGIHLIIATQRPSVDVITGLIKANVPSRISFAVASSHDSRTILDMVGAEKLLGKGDMLYYPNGSNKPVRAQGAFVSDKEVHNLVQFWKEQGEPTYEEDVTQQPTVAEAEEEADDELFDDAVRLIIENDSASISMLQRRFRIGYSRAARLIDMMELRGIVGPYQGSRPREVLVRSYEEDTGDV